MTRAERKELQRRVEAALTAAAALVAEIENCEANHGGLLLRDTLTAASKLRLALQNLN